VNPIAAILDPQSPGGVLSLTVYGLIAARFIGIMAVMPLFTRTSVDRVVRFGIAVGLAAPLAYEIMRQIPSTSSVPLWMMGLLLLKEIIIGMGLGLVFSLPIWAIGMAGDVIDSYRNANAANTTDPVNSNEVSVFGTYLVILGLALFVAAGGIQMMISATYRSFGLWPIMSLAPVASLDSAGLLYSLLYQVGRIAFIIAAPLLVLMVLVDIVLMAFTRMNPQFQVFETSNSLKNLAMIMSLPIYVTFFSEYMNVQWPKLFGNITTLIPVP
jgi:type III secretion protein T